MKERLPKLTSYLFCLTVMLDPMNNLMGLKVPLFLLFAFSLLINFKADYKYIPIISFLVIWQFVSLGSGALDNQDYEFPMTIQYLIYFLLYIILLWRKHIDILEPLIFSSIIVSIITIIGFVAMTSFPDFFELIYAWADAHDNFIMISKRNFLGVEFNQVFYKSLPLVIIPAAYYSYKFAYERANRSRHLVLVILFLFALFCSGNRALMGSLFLIVFFVNYKKISRMKLFVPILVAVFIVAMYILFQAITDTSEASADIKRGHMLSYIDYFTNKWYLLPFGSGAGSLFYTKDYGMTPITEMTYMEIIRMYGVGGLFLILYFFLIPLSHYKKKVKVIKYWKPFSISYILYLIISGSNPYLISSTGFMCILLMYTVVSNPKYSINNGSESKS